LNTRETNECRISTNKRGVIISHDFEVSSAPVSVNGEKYSLVHIVDISHNKRSELLENIFFHDILNRLGSLIGLIHVIKNENLQPRLAEYISMLHSIGEMIIEDIQTQRSLTAAENEKYILNIHEHSALEILETVNRQLSFHPVLKNSGILIKIECDDFRLRTDSTLLKRILINMIKNAAEAQPGNHEITLSCKTEKGLAFFNVHNAGKIPKYIQSQIFQRSFSTKGQGRGFGTYSMKLFGETYLKGKVYFRSDTKTGTVFTVELPVIP